MKKLIAKQNYRCDMCGRLIKKGYVYKRERGKWVIDVVYKRRFILSWLKK